MNSSASSDRTRVLLAFDREHLWHPYGSMRDPLPVYAVKSASGSMLMLEDGRELVDGMSSWWSAIHGYNHPVLNRAVEEQMKSMSHVMFGGLTHGPAVELARLLVSIAPAGLEKVFLCDSGSVSVEVAMKLAMQYWHARGAPRGRFLTVRSGYHGDTFHAMSVCDPVTGMHSLFRGSLPEQYFADAPPCGYNEPWDETHIGSFKKLLLEHRDAIAGVILEPIVQGAGGMRFYSPLYLRRVRELCDENGVLLILDEIATGFGRTGMLFGCSHAGISPDIMCIGKAMTGGYMTMAAVLTTEMVSSAVSNGDPGCLMHGPTFMANPLAAAVSRASIELLLGSPWEQRVSSIESRLREGLRPCEGLPGVRDVRSLGAIGVVELAREVDMEKITEAFVQRGVWIRPFGRLVYVMPPFIVTGEQIDRLTGAMTVVIAGGSY